MRTGARVVSAGFDAAQFEASQRVISELTRLANFYRLHAEQAREIPPPPPPDELAQAYAVLGLNETATKADVKQRRMDLIKQWHPDQFAQDPEELKRANERTAQVNAAYGVIMMRRGWT
jgi:DnaJ like chaperone protein